MILHLIFGINAQSRLSIWKKTVTVKALRLTIRKYFFVIKKPNIQYFRRSLMLFNQNRSIHARVSTNTLN